MNPRQFRNPECVHDRSTLYFRTEAQHVSDLTHNFCVAPGVSEATLHLLTQLRGRLRIALRRQTLAEVVFGVLILLAVSAALLLLAAGAEALLWMGVGLRSMFFWSFVLGALGLFGYFIALPLLRLAGILAGRTERTAAHRAGVVHPAVGDRLTTLLDLAEGRATDAPSPLVDQAMQSLGMAVEPVPFERVEDLQPMKRAAPWAVAPLLGLLAFFLAAPVPFSGAIDRLFAPTTEFEPPAPFSFEVLPGDVELARGEALEIVARPVGRDYPPDAILEFGRPDEDAVDRTRMSLSDDGLFSHTIPNVRADLRYRITAAGVHSRPVISQWYEVTIVARPVVRGLQVSLAPPGYTGLPARRLAPGVGDVLGLAGSSIRVRIELGEAPLAEAALVIRWSGGDPQTIPLAVDGETATGSFGLRGEGEYSIHLVGENGLQNENPVRYSLGVLADSPPQIILIEGAEGSLSGEARRRVRFRITDDFGFSGASLLWRVAERLRGEGDRGFRRVALPLSGSRQLDQEVVTNWLLRTSGGAIQPGDVVEFYGEVRDNDAVHGFKAARTSVYTLRYPSLDEQFDRLEETQNEAEDQLDDLEEGADELRDRFEELRDDIRRDPEPNWEDERQLEQILQQHESIQQQVQSITEQMRNMLEQMQQGDLVSEETMELYEAMQQVMEELDSPELREALEMLREAMEQMDLQQMMQSLEDIEFNEEDFRERLERAMELFERLRTAQELDEAAQRAEDLAEQEAALAEATESMEDRQNEGETSEQQSAAEREQLASDQERAQEQMQELQEMLEQLAEKMQDQAGAPNEQMQEMMEQMEQQDLQQQMQENAEQLRQNELSPAQQSQQQMQQQLQNMSQQLMNMSSEMQSGQKQANISGLRRILDDVLTLSEEEERLGDETSALPSRSPALRPIAQQQVELAEGLATVSDSLHSIAREIPQMDWAIQSMTNDALREMGQATERLAELQPGPASGHQKTAMTHLNELALMLSELLDQMQNGSGSGSGMSMQQMMQQMQQMGQQQQGLSDQMQQMLNDMAGERLSQSQSERLQQAAAQQEAIRQQLQEMLREGGSNLDAQTRSALQRAVEEMRDAAREMRQGSITRETIPRQQQILQRLLEAERSVNQRGREERREGQTGEEQEADRPNRLNLNEYPAERLRRDLIRALESGYAPDYQDLIKEYFERLQNRTSG